MAAARVSERLSRSFNAPATVEWSAFISYSRRDTTFVELLERALERFRVPASLGTRTRHLRVFRDVGDLTGSDYYAAIERNLKAAKKMIVICSPAARSSRYVSDEITRFLKVHEAEDVIPLLVEGRPNNECDESQEDQKAFPQVLCDAMEMPLAASYLEFDPKKDAVNKGRFSNSWYTILANLLDRSRIEIEQRDQKRQRQWRNTIGAITTGVFLSLTALTLFAFDQRADAIAEATIARSRELVASAHIAPLAMYQRKLLLAVEAARLLDGMDTDKSLAVETLRTYLGVLPNRVLFGHQQRVEHLAFSSNGEWLGSADGDGVVMLWTMQTDPPNGRALNTRQSPTTALVFSRDGKVLAAGFRSGLVKLWSTERTDGPALSLTESKSEVTALESFRIPETGNWRVVAAHRDGSVSGWTVEGDLSESLSYARWEQHVGPVTLLRMSPSGAWIVSTGEDGRAAVRRSSDLASSVTSTAVDSPGIVAADFGPDRNGPVLALGGRDRRLRIWEPSGTRAPRVIGEHADAITDVRFSPSGEWIASSSADGLVHLWDASDTDGQIEPLPRPGHTDWVSGVRFSRDGRWLATFGYDGTARIWDLGNLFDSPLVLMGHEYPITDAAFSPDGQRLVTASRDGTMRVWDLDPSARWSGADLPELTERACGFVSRNFYPDEWSLHFPGMVQRPTCDDLPVPAEAIGFYVENHRLVAVAGPATAFNTANSFSRNAEIVPEFLVMHGTASPPGGAARWLDSKMAQASVHAVIGRDGSVLQLVPFITRAWHTGPSVFEDRRGLNGFSIGIDMDNYMRLERDGNRWTSIFDQPVPPEEVVLVERDEGQDPESWHAYSGAQIEVAQQIGRVLVQHYGLRNAFGHADIAPERKVDPGPAFPMQSFREYVLSFPKYKDQRSESAQNP